MLRSPKEEDGAVRVPARTITESAAMRAYGASMCRVNARVQLGRGAATLPLACSMRVPGGLRSGAIRSPRALSHAAHSPAAADTAYSAYWLQDVTERCNLGPGALPWGLAASPV